MTKRIFTFLGSIVTSFSVFHFIINLLSSEEYTFELSIKLIKDTFISYPILVTILTIVAVLGGIIIRRPINSLYERLFEKEKLLTRNKNRLDKIKRIRDEFHKVVFQKFNNPREIPPEPYYKIKANFSEINTIDINDTNFPESRRWGKYEVFDYLDDGIELLASDNITGFDLLVDENGFWDVIRKGLDEEARNDIVLQKITHTRSIAFLPYEGIEDVDWKRDPYEGNISLRCNYRYSTNGFKHPFSEERFYEKTGWGGYIRMENDKRRNFKKYNFKQKLMLIKMTFKNTFRN